MSLIRLCTLPISNILGMCLADMAGCSKCESALLITKGSFSLPGMRTRVEPNSTRGLAFANRQTILNTVSVVGRCRRILLKKPDERTVRGMLKIAFRFFGDCYSEVKGQVDPKSFFETPSVHKEVLKRIRLSPDLRTIPFDLWRYASVRRYRCYA